MEITAFNIFQEDYVGDSVDGRGQQDALSCQLFLGKASFGFRLFRLGDIRSHGDKMGYLSGIIGDRRNRDRSPVELAALFAVLDFTVPHLALKDGLPQRLILTRRSVSAFQNAWILANDFIGLVTCHLGKSRIDVLDVASHIGDHHAQGALLHRLRHLAQLIGALVDQQPQPAAGPFSEPHRQHSKQQRDHGDGAKRTQHQRAHRMIGLQRFGEIDLGCQTDIQSIQPAPGADNRNSTIVTITRDIESMALIQRLFRHAGQRPLGAFVRGLVTPQQIAAGIADAHAQKPVSSGKILRQHGQLVVKS